MSGLHLEQILVDPNTTRASLKKRLKQLVDSLWVGDPEAEGPAEALELALGRDNHLQQKFIKDVVDASDEVEEGRYERRREEDGDGRIILSISCGRHLKEGKDSPPPGKNMTEKELKSWNGCRNRHHLMVILSEELDVVNKIVRILKLDAPPKISSSLDGVVANSSPEKKVDDLPWNALWICATDIILHMLRNRKNLSSDLANSLKFISDSKFMEACMRFMDGKKCMMTAVVMSYSVSQCLEYCDDKDLCNRFFDNNGIGLCAEYLHKDMGVKKFIHWWKSKRLHSWEHQALFLRCWIYYNTYCGTEHNIWSWEKSPEVIRQLLVHWGRAMSVNCARALALVAAKGSESGRLSLLKNKTLIKGMVFWFHCPIMVHRDMEMICCCTKLIANLCANETFALYFIREHNLISHLEVLIFCPNYKILVAYLDLAAKLASHQGICRDTVAKSKVIVKALLSYCCSYEREVCLNAVTATTHLLTGQTAKVVMDCGFNIRQLIIWNDYSFYHDLCHEWGKMKTAVKASGVRDWHSQEVRLKGNKAMGTNNFDEDEASSRKERGNVAFKRQEYKKAITLYTDALKFCPPSKQTIPCICLHYENVGNCRGHNCGCTYELWTPLPAQLYSNRAQCYLNLGKYKEAVENCDEAVARCLEDSTEAKELLQKSIYRRAKAALERGDLKKALSDAGFWIVQDQDKQPDKQDPEATQSMSKLFDEIFFKYRQVHGYHYVRRCSVCMKGEGEKLKRCANCEELYCSKECQMNDWTKRHKEMCPGNKKKNEKEKEKSRNGMAENRKKKASEDEVVPEPPRPHLLTDELD